MILLKPIITEKSHQATSRGVFTFAVLPLASKSQIRQEVVTLFKAVDWRELPKLANMLGFNLKLVKPFPCLI